MRPGMNRRNVLKATFAPALAGCLPLRFAEAEPKFTQMPAEGKDTPKICLGFGGPVDEPGMRRLKQIGVDHVLTGGPKIPWTEADVRARIEQFRAGGLTLYNLMISGFDDVIWGRPGAEAQIADVIASIRAAGKAGLPIVEYNFYANRLMEGYKEETGRAGAGYTAYDYDAVEGPAAQGRRGHPHPGRAARAGEALPESRGARGREGERPSGPPSERSTRAAEPRVGAADGDASRTGRSISASSRAPSTA